jgi:hypothetical protein
LPRPGPGPGLAFSLSLFRSNLTTTTRFFLPPLSPNLIISASYFFHCFSVIDVSRLSVVALLRERERVFLVLLQEQAKARRSREIISVFNFILYILSLSLSPLPDRPVPSSTSHLFYS